MPRSLGAIPPAMLEANLRWFVFIKWVFITALPPLVIRFTDYSDGATKSLVLDVDGTGPNRWDATIPFDIGEIATSLATIQDISTIMLANSDDFWSDLVNQYGIAAFPFEIWVGFFEPTGYPPAFVGAVPIFIGVTERASYGDTITVYLLPNAVPFSRRFPRGRFTASEGYGFLPPSPLIIKWGDVNAIVQGASTSVINNPIYPTAPPPDLTDPTRPPVVPGPHPPPVRTVGSR